MSPFLKNLALKELLMRFLGFGTMIFGFCVKFCMEMMILRIFANGSNFEELESQAALNEIL